MKTATFAVLSVSWLSVIRRASAQLRRPRVTPVTSDLIRCPAVKADGDARRPGPPPRSRDYRLAAGDKLRIEVYKDAQLSQSLQVRPDGKITLPLVGDVAAAGRTPMELRDAIGTR